MNKKIILSLVFTLLIGCGFAPMLKDFDMDSLHVKKIDYSGKNELTYLLKTYINIYKEGNSKGLIIDFDVVENIKTATKDNAGTVIEEDLTLVIKFKVFNSENSMLLNDSISEFKRIKVTNSLSTDEETKRTERRNLIQNLAKKIKFKLQLITKRQK